MFSMPIGDSSKIAGRQSSDGHRQYLGLAPTVTNGIVSALRTATWVTRGLLKNAIQTSAPINATNSGGALVNAVGELDRLRRRRRMIPSSRLPPMASALPFRPAF